MIPMRDYITGTFRRIKRISTIKVRIKKYTYFSSFKLLKKWIFKIVITFLLFNKNKKEVIMLLFLVVNQ